MILNELFNVRRDLSQAPDMQWKKAVSEFTSIQKLIFKACVSLQSSWRLGRYMTPPEIEATNASFKMEEGS